MANGLNALARQYNKRNGHKKHSYVEFSILSLSGSEEKNISGEEWVGRVEDIGMILLENTY